MLASTYWLPLLLASLCPDPRPGLGDPPAASLAPEGGRTEDVDEAEEPAPAFVWGENVSVDFLVYGNFLARKDRGPLFDEDGEDYSDAARLRQLDFVVDSALAPGVDAFVAASVQSDRFNDEFEIELDQAYLEFTELPGLGGLPAGSSIKIGQFRTGFGRLNRERLFELPQVNRPYALAEFLGDGGYAELGASGNFLLPVADAGGVRFTAEYLDSGSPPLTLEDGGATGATMFRLGWAPPADARHALEVGVSRLHSRRADRASIRAKLEGFDALYAYRPRPEAGPAFLVGGELVSAEVDEESGNTERPEGYYVWSNVRLAPEWYVGGRLDVVEEIDDEGASSETVGLVVGHVPSPNLRYAVVAERTSSDVPLLDDVTRVFVELNFAVGTRPPRRPFWR